MTLITTKGIEFEVSPSLTIEGGYLVERNCMVTSALYGVLLDPIQYEQFEKWTYGFGNVQDIERLSADEREFLLSGISPEGWSRAFGSGYED